MPELHREQGILTEKIAVYPTIRKWADGFFVAKRAQGIASTTFKYYRKRLLEFIDCCNAYRITTIEGIDANLIREFILYLKDTGHNPGGVHGYYAVIKAFLRWYEVEAEPEGWRNPVKKVKAPKVPELILDPADPDDVRKVIDSLGDEVRDLRDKAILRTLYDTGLRAKELLSLDLADFDYASGALLVRDGKGGKPRFVFVGRKTRLAIRAYLKKRGDTPGPLFLTRSKVRPRMTYSCLRLIYLAKANGPRAFVPAVAETLCKTVCRRFAPGA